MNNSTRRGGRSVPPRALIAVVIVAAVALIGVYLAVAGRRNKQQSGRPGGATIPAGSPQALSS
jgi:hypothetical protein